MIYQNLNEDEQWLAGDNPGNIGGRDTDVSQIACSLERHVKDWFEINEVPQTVVDQLITLKCVCLACEKAISDTIELVGDYVRQYVGNG